MPRRVVLALAGCVVYGALGLLPDPAPRPGRAPLRTLLADQRLFARERDNACLDKPLDDARDRPTSEPAGQACPDWVKAHIAGGGGPPTPAVSDPFPTLHSVAVDPINDRVFVSDPNRHALWSYERLPASTRTPAGPPLDRPRAAARRLS